MDIQNFYNHENFIDSVKQGEKILNNTNFAEYEKQRKQACNGFNVGDIVDNNGMQAVIVGIDKNILIIKPCGWFTSKGKIRKQYKEHGGYFANPCHVSKVK